MGSIAIVEDDLDASEQFRKALLRDGHTVTTFATRSKAEQGLAKGSFDAVLLDLMMNGDASAGIGLIAMLGRSKQPPPVLVISSLDPSIYRPNCLELGVWDFLPKPIEERTLQIKVQRLLDEKQLAATTSEHHTVGSLSWETGMVGKLTWQGKQVGLPRISYRIVLKLVRNAGKIQPHQELYKLFDTPLRSDTPQARQNLRAHIKTLRDAFRDADPGFTCVQTVEGGYCWIE
jgi:DNA-binding response OmpR family regulator